MIVDDQQIVIEGLKSLLLKHFEEPEFIQVSVLNIGKLNNKPDLVIIDIKLFESYSLRIIKKIRRVSKKTKVLVFTSLDESVYAIPHLEAGVSGYLSRNSKEAEILDAIETVLAGNRYFSYKIKELMFDQIINNYRFINVAPDNQPLFRQERGFTK